MTRGKVLIVSKTRMKEGRVCVGGIDLTNNTSVRLLDHNGHHEQQETCPFNIRDLWEVEYIKDNRRPMPHLHEDVDFFDRRQTGVLPKEVKMVDILQEHGIPICTGSIYNVFDGLIKSTDNGSMYICQPDVPSFSTCFWICDKSIKTTPNREKGGFRCRYQDDQHRYGLSIPYQGLDMPVQYIREGTLIRLSLAHWWSGQTLDAEPRCYLQVSGYYEQ